MSWLLILVRSVLCILLILGSVGVLGAAQDLASEGTARASVAPPPAPLVLTLRGALDAAVDNNPTVQLYRERIEAAQAQVLTQFGAMMPSVSSNVRQSRQTQFLGTFGLAPIRTNPFGIFDARVNASQNLVNVSLIQKWRASREALNATEFEADVNKFDTMGSVALLYLEGLKAEALVKAHETNQLVMNELLGVVKQRHRSGVSTGLDTARLEAQLANEGQLLSAARYDRTRALLNLVTQLGLPIETPVALTSTFQSEVKDLAAHALAVEEAITKRSEVQGQFKRVRAAELMYASTTGERIPSLVAQGDYGLIGNRYANTLDTYNMALLLQVPIFDGAQREGRISEARSQLRQEGWRMRSVLNQVKLEVHDALAGLAAAQEQVAIANGGLQSAARELNLARERFVVVTTANQFEVTNALVDVARARENVVTALYQLNAARVNLARATGNLNTLN